MEPGSTPHSSKAEPEVLPPSAPQEWDLDLIQSFSIMIRELQQLSSLHSPHHQPLDALLTAASIKYFANPKLGSEN